MSKSEVYTSFDHINEFSIGLKEKSKDAIIRYHTVPDFPGWEKANLFLSRIIDAAQPRIIFEIGSGANPTLKSESIRGTKIRYITSDIDPVELDIASSNFESLCIDLENDTLPADLLGRCDVLFSRMVNEHIRDGEKYHRNLYRLLAPNGIAVHCFSALGCLPFLVNRFVPDWIATRLFQFFSPRDDQHKKFRAYYSWSRGPTQSMVKNFQSLGYEVVSYNGYFGHNYYRDRLPLLNYLESVKSRLLLRTKLAVFCAYGVVILRKPQLAADAYPSTSVAR